MGKEVKVLEGLAEALGLQGASRFDVLRTAAEALGCDVASDGTTTVRGEASEEEEEEEAADPAQQRKRPRTSGRAAIAVPGEEPGEEEGVVDVEGDFDEEPDDVAAAASSDDGSGDDSGDEADGWLTQSVGIVDPRQPGEVMVPDEIAADGYDDVFQWLISPLNEETFEAAVYERQPAVVSRPHNRAYFAGLLSRAEVDRMLRTAPGLRYTYQIDVTNYLKGRRLNYNHNGPGASAAEAEEGQAADADVVWRRFDRDGCSVRLLHPQRASDGLWRLLARLEGYWRSCLGCNAYLTPPGAQGFAPHWDDIDAFVLQVEGAKRWRLYAPTAREHVLPRHPSRDFGREELGESVLDVVLQPGDLLYMPRGTVHEAQSLPDSHSLHLTLSANQQTTWAALFEELLPRALKQAAQRALRLRRALPRGFAGYMGAVHAADEEPGAQQAASSGDDEDGGAEARRELRAAFQQHAQRCVESVVDSLDLDWAADQCSEAFMLQRLPPVLPPVDEGAAGGSGPVRLSPSSAVRMVLPGVARLVIDADGAEPEALVCHCLSNSREQHAAAGDEEGGEGLGAEAGAEAAVPPQIEFPLGCADTLAALLAAERAAVAVSDLPEPDPDTEVTAVEVAQALVDAGLVARVSSAR